MAGEWPKAKIAEVAERVAMGPFGSSIKVSTFVDQGIPVISGQHLRGSRLEDNEFNFVTVEHADSLKNANVFRGDVVFTHAGNIGQCAYIPETSKFSRYVLSQRQFYMRCNKSKVIPEFVTCFFKSAAGRHALLANASQTGVPSIARPVSYVRTIEIPLPPLPTQRAIAHVLGTLDDMIELNRETNEILEEMARALFKSWFVDFDPVRAKLEGRPPAGMDAATAALFPDHFQDSELGQIPKGWENATIGDLCEINGWTLGKNDKIETLEYVEISEVNRGDVANMVTYLRGAEPSRARRRLRHGDTVLSTVRPDRGAYFLALSPPQNRVASTGFAVLTPSKAPWSFVHAAMTQPEISDHLGHLADGGAYPAVRPEIISGIEVVVPSTSTIFEAFHNVCGPLFEAAESNRLESRDLAALRDTLLPKLLSGEISAPAAEEQIAAST
jgi:type I restriction enzyme S subunit